MPLTVFKYSWPGSGDRAQFDMMPGAEVIHVDNQREQICLWVRGNPSSESVERRTFVLCGTGHPAPGGPHVGTVLLQGGRYVFHIFEEVSK